MNSLEVQYEHELAWADRIIPIYGGGELASAPAGPPLPEPLVRAIALLERFDMLDDLAESCNPAISRDLTTLITSRMIWLTAAGRLPHTDTPLAHLSPREQLHRLSAVVASLLTYDYGLISSGVVARLRRIAAVVTEAIEDPAKEALAYLREPTSAVCRHYASLMSTLFFALRVTSDRPATAYLAKLVGDVLDSPQLATTESGHMWNLLLDIERGALFGIDVTWADGVHERGSEPFDLGLANTTLHRHASGLLGWLGNAWNLPSSVLHHHPDVETVFAHTIDPTSPRGVTLLFHLAEGYMLCEASRARIIAHLEREPFETLVPEWRTRLARYRGHDFTAGDWNPLLDRVGL